ncbi:glycosyltransferase family 2 protein [Moraxella sp. ZJ142]|uniref:glycosyltransferase family 2 protein n=1 Tax=Moraxella marmotae TaxID=3344520 RepID=UPI0035D4694A
MPTLDVIIPCYHAAATLERAILSTLEQTACRRIILVDDGSSDATPAIIRQLADAYPDKITALFLANNSGVAAARNFGAMASDADLLAFLDADDAYEPHALDILPSIFEMMPQLSLVRLKLRPVNLAERYATHPNLTQAWDILQMTVGGNTIFRKSIFLACGGFPQDELFRELGGEDGALGIALAQMTAVGTLFGDQHAGILHHCRDGMHAERLLDAYLFNQHDERITATHTAYAQAVSERIKAQLASVRPVVSATAIGRTPLIVEYA